MIRLQHVSFKDWNPIGKPHKKTKEKSENLSESVKCGTSNAENLSKKSIKKCRPIWSGSNTRINA